MAKLRYEEKENISQKTYSPDALPKQENEKTSKTSKNTVKHESVKKILAKENVEIVRQAANCTECRECEKRCPFNLDIVEGLKRVRNMVEDLITESGA